VNGVPGTQTFAEDATRVFSSVNGNQISVADVDTTNLSVTLGATHGVLTLSGITGLSFSAGDCTPDAAIIFSGTPSAVNTALNGVIFPPAANYNGSATITLQSSDSLL